MTATIVLYATDTMADWEYGYVVAGIAMAAAENPESPRLTVATERGATVRTAGGLQLTADTTLAELDESEIAALILPGADTWESNHDAALDLSARLIERDIPVAGICGATFGLARRGLLNDRAHTSNALDYLETAPGYAGQVHYRDERTVHDGPLITAPATAPVDFARAIFESVGLFPPFVLDAWHGLYATGERRYYDQLTGA